MRKAIKKVETLAKIRTSFMSSVNIALLNNVDSSISTRIYIPYHLEQTHHNKFPIKAFWYL